MARGNDLVRAEKKVTRMMRGRRMRRRKDKDGLRERREDNEICRICLNSLNT